MVQLDSDFAECSTCAILKLRVIDLKAILSDSLTLKNDLFLEIFSRRRATQSFYQGKLNKQRKTFKKSKGGSLPLV